MTDHRSGKASADRAQQLVGHSVVYHNGGLHDSNMTPKHEAGNEEYALAGVSRNSHDRMPMIRGLRDPKTLPPDLSA